MIEPSANIVASVMCTVARDQTWARGKRNFLRVNANLYGINLTLRTKNNLMALNPLSQDWRAEVHSFSVNDVAPATIRLEDNAKVVRLPKVPAFYTRAPITTFEPYTVHAPSFIVINRPSFERDWTLLQMFISDEET